MTRPVGQHEVQVRDVALGQDEEGIGQDEGERREQGAELVGADPVPRERETETGGERRQGEPGELFGERREHETREREGQRVHAGCHQQPVLPPDVTIPGVAGMVQADPELTVLGQEAPQDVRGAVFGLAGIFASAGILFTTAFGGWLYDVVDKGMPFFMIGIVNISIMIFGLYLLISAKSKK